MSCTSGLSVRRIAFGRSLSVELPTSRASQTKGKVSMRSSSTYHCFSSPVSKAPRRNSPVSVSRSSLAVSEVSRRSFPVSEGNYDGGKRSDRRYISRILLRLIWTLESLFIYYCVCACVCMYGSVKGGRGQGRKGKEEEGCEEGGEEGKRRRREKRSTPPVTCHKYTCQPHLCSVYSPDTCMRSLRPLPSLTCKKKTFN